MDANKPHITFPLDSLLLRLELAGFAISPAQRVQLLRVLQAFGQDHLRDLDKLKFRLCPIVARNEQEQLRFYELFDAYLQEIQTEEWQLPEEEPVLKWWQKIPRWLWVVGLLLLFGVVVYILFEREPELDPVFRSMHPTSAEIGDTVYFENRSANFDSSKVSFEWQLIDKETGVLEEASQSRDWSYLVREQGENPVKQVLLIASDTAVLDTFRTSLLIRCSDLPQVEKIVGLDRAEVGDTVHFSLEMEEKNSLSFEWLSNTDSLGGSWLGGIQNQEKVAFIFAKAGVYNIQADIKRVGAVGFCQIEIDHSIVVGGDRAFLESKPLEKDDLNTLASFSLGTWILLALLGIYLLYHSVKWLNQPPPPPDQEKEKKRLQKRFANSDKGPYFIPFRNRSGLIRIDPAMYRLADILRQRQEGLRTELDVPGTVQRTVEQGGFPQVQLRYTTVPSEYLFLIDEQATNSLQANLYDFLAQFFQDKDVHVSTFHYQKDFNRFWNAANPEGISLEQLQRLFPHYRLMILGDAHSLLDLQATQRVGLKERYTKTLHRWKNRLLLTPLPAIDWTYLEGALYDHFPVFPGDVDGFQSAMTFLELALEEEDDIRPGFDRWQTQMAEEHPQPAVNYRRWNRIQTYRNYLKDHPFVYKWFCALAIYPTPSWEMTIAIGRALEPKGVAVNFDNLLLFSRIPWLQGRPISPKLRFALLEELDAESEELARQAVRQELEAVAPLVAGSHANAELQTNLVIQKFVIEPHDTENRKALRHLDEQGLINKKQRAELDNSLERRTDIAENDVDAFLRQTDESALPVAAKVKLKMNNHFYKALLSSLLFLLLGIIIWNFGGTNAFYKMVFGEGSRSISADSTHLLRDYFFVEETTYIDSAVVYNNAGVDFWRAAEEDQRHRDTAVQNEALGFFQKAVDYRKSGDYLLGRANIGRLHYQKGTDRYHQYLENFSPSAMLNTILPSFHTAAKYEVTLGDGLHGQGLVHWYRSQAGFPAALDSASYYYERLQALGFFDTLSIRPNLETLLFPGRCPALDYEIPEFSKCNGGELTLINRTNNADQQVLYYVVDWGDGQSDSLQSFETLQHNYDLQDCNTLNILLRVRAGYLCSDGRSGVTRKNEELILSSSPNLTVSLGKETYCIGEPVSVNMSGAICEGAQYTWDFGDGTTSQETNPNHIYARAGNYTIQVDVANSCGESNETLTLRVNDCGTPVSARALRLVAIDSSTSKTIAGAQLRWSGGSGVTDLFGSYILTYQEGQFETLDITAAAPGYEALEKKVDLIREQQQQQQAQQQVPQVPYEQEIRLFLKPIPKSMAKAFRALQGTTQDNFNITMALSVDFTPVAEIYEEDILRPGLEKVVPEVIKYYTFSTFSGLRREEIALEIRANLERQIGSSQITINQLNVLDWEGEKPVGPEEFSTTMVAPVDEGIRLEFEDDAWESANSYEIQYSRDGTSFEAIFRIQPTTSKDAVFQQEYLHRQVRDGRNYYRFLRIDKNGTELFSKIETVVWESPVTALTELLLGIEMVQVEGGTFTMGCDEKQDKNCSREEQPPHLVTLTDFYIGKYEITNAQFTEFLNAKGNEEEGGGLWYRIKSRSARIEEQKIKNRNGKLGTDYTIFQVENGYEDVPVSDVNFYGAQAFCQWLSEETGGNYRLPTEAEWEYAARGGLQGMQYRYDYSGSNQAEEVAWHDKNTRRRIRSNKDTEANLKPNALGIFNMSGNVYEWCLDCWNPNYNGASDTGAARQDGDCSTRVIRGGSSDKNLTYSRVSHRWPALVGANSDYIGFRVVQYR